MNPAALKALLEEVQRGVRGIESALDELRRLPFADLGYARVDHHRSLRQGVPEVVLAEGKTLEQIIGVTRELISAHKGVFVTRLNLEHGTALVSALPEVEYLNVARIARYLPDEPLPLGTRPVFVVTAGTSDIPVAEEAVVTLEVCGAPVERLYDVGVAGIHRLVGHLGALGKASAVIVVAGMEGALASVVGGLIAAPIVAVPTSVGYGVSMGGLTAMFAMLSSCASGVTVVNIDNGFGAAMAVVRMLRAQHAAEVP